MSRKSWPLAFGIRTGRGRVIGRQEAAIPALAAGDPGIPGYTVTDLDLTTLCCHLHLGLIADLFNNAEVFMAKYQRTFHKKRSGRQAVKKVLIRAANAAHLHFHQGHCLWIF